MRKYQCAWRNQVTASFRCFINPTLDGLFLCLGRALYEGSLTLEVEISIPDDNERYFLHDGSTITGKTLFLIFATYCRPSKIGSLLH